MNDDDVKGEKDPNDDNQGGDQKDVNVPSGDDDQNDQNEDRSEEGKEENEDEEDKDTEQPKSNWHYDPEENVVNKSEDVTKADLKRNYTWKQAEFVAHEKSQGWYLSLIGITIVVAGATYLLMHDFLSVFIIIIVAIIFGVMAGRQPREMEYSVGSQGVKIQQAFRSYKDFKSFAVINEGDLGEIVFLPLKRFSPPMTIYFDEKQAEEVLNIVADHLPQDQQAGNDVVDRFIRNIRF